MTRRVPSDSASAAMGMRCFNIYVSACAENGGIYRYISDGEYVELAEKYPLDRPMYLIVKENKLYCLLRAPFKDSDESGLVSFDINRDGSLSGMTAPKSTHGIVACHLAESDGNIYLANYLSGNVVKMPDTVSAHSGKGADPKRQDAPHTHFVCEAADGKYILATDLGIDKIFVYNKDLSIHSVTDMPSGHGPRHIACSENGNTVYCVNELKSTLSRLKYSDGRLTLIDTVPTLPFDFRGTNTAAAIRLDGDKAYISHRGFDAISVMNVSGEKPFLEKTVPVFGRGPRDLWLTDKFFICTNEASNNVTFTDRDSGALLYEFEAESPISVFCAESDYIIAFSKNNFIIKKGEEKHDRKSSI